MLSIQPQVERDFNLSSMPFAPWVEQNQPMVSDAGKVIKAALARLGKTQRWLAETLDVSDNAVSKWIKSGKIARENIGPLAAALRIQPSELLPGYALKAERPAELQTEEPAAAAYGLAVHLDAIRQTAKGVADAFGMSLDEVLAAVGSAGKSKPAGAVKEAVSGVRVIDSNKPIPSGRLSIAATGAASSRTIGGSQ